MEPLIRTQQEAGGLLLATIDMPGRSMNVFSASLMDALEALLDQVEADADVQAVVLTSAKPTFLAGADLVMVRGFTDSARTLSESALFDLCGRLGRLFVRLEAQAKPWVAAVNGLALGGGLELAMACRERIVVDDARVQLGLPEVRWGLLPGAGGTQRLPRLAGFDTGLSMLLTGRSINPQEAVKHRVFRQAVPAERLLDEARALALSLRGSAFDPKVKFAHIDQSDVPACNDDNAWSLAQRHGVTAEFYRDYPAYRVIIDCVLLGARLPLAEASAAEMRQFLRLMIDPVAGNMIRSLFLNRQRADKALAAPRELRIEQVITGPWSPANTLWPEALARSRIDQREDASLPPDQIQLIDSRGITHTVAACLLSTASQPTPAARAVLTPVGPYGRVLEIIGANADTAAALAALASRLQGALPYRSGDQASVLQRLHAAGAHSLDEQAVAALLLLATGAAPDADFLDVAACAGNVTPAFTGGPLAHLWARRAALTEGFDAPASAAWQRVQATLQESFA